MPDLKKYVVEFFYNDNDELYRCHYKLTADEYQKVIDRLQRLINQGKIRHADGTACDEAGCMVSTYYPPDFYDYADFNISSQGDEVEVA